MANSNYRIKEVKNGLGETWYYTEVRTHEETRTNYETWQPFETIKNAPYPYFTYCHDNLEDARAAIKKRIEVDRIVELRKQTTERVIPYED